MAAVLLYNIKDSEKLSKLKMLLFKLGLDGRIVEAEEFSRPISALLSIETEGEAADESEYTAFEREMLVMHALSSFQFNALLDGMRRMKATVALKAVVTETNMNWSSLRLYRELSTEHEAMNRLRGSAAAKSIHKKK